MMNTDRSGKERRCINMEDKFEKMLKEFMFGEETAKRVNQHLDAAKKSWTESGERTRRQVLQTMERNFEAELFRTVGLRIAGTLAAEGPLLFGAGNRTRTGTLLTARDFKSLVSTDFTMPAWCAGSY